MKPILIDAEQVIAEKGEKIAHRQEAIRREIEGAKAHAVESMEALTIRVAAMQAAEPWEISSAIHEAQRILIHIENYSQKG